MVIHGISHIWTDIKHVWICSKHLWFSSYSIHHLDFYTYQFSPIAHNFPSLALYLDGATESFVLAVPYDNISDISEFYQAHIRSIQVLHHIGIITCDLHHNFAAIQGIDCVTNCLNLCTLWEGVWKYLFYISYFVFRSYFFLNNKHSDNSPTSSVDEIPAVSPLPSCRFYTLAHDHQVHDLFIKLFHRK